jgi:hypothetical protein
MQRARRILLEVGAYGNAVGTYLEWLLRELPKAEAQPREGKLDLTPFLSWNYKARFTKG